MNDNDYARLGAHKFEQEVDKLFEAEKSRVLACREEYGRVPYLDYPYCVLDGEEIIAMFKRNVCLALAAKKWFEQHKPSWAPSLPLSPAEWEKVANDDDLRFELVCDYAASLAGLQHDYLAHPSFHDYCCALLTHEHTPDYLRTDPQLQQEFPPRKLAGLYGSSYWPPEMVAEWLQMFRRNCQYQYYSMSDEKVIEQIADLGECYSDRFAGL
jgi:hypothetical protein